MSHLSPRVNRIQPSPTIAVSMKAAALKRQGIDIIGLGTGEPDFDTPDFIKHAAIKAIEKGDTKYTAVDGTPALKEAIIQKFAKENGLNYEANQILVSCGAKQSCYNATQALLSEGDEAIIPAPYWVSYPAMVELADAKPVILETDQSSAYKITPEQLAAAITPNTKLLFLNSPSNPSGKAYTKAELAALGEVLLKHPQVTILSDDIYEHILWSGDFCNIVNACPELKDRTLVINGVSKAYAMTGWRIGYAAGEASIIAAMKKVQSQSTSNPCSIAQAASVAALTGDQSCLTEMNAAFKARHDLVVGALKMMPGVKCLEGDGTFYAFPDFSDWINAHPTINDDLMLAEALIEDAKLAIVPGSAFGTKNHLRLSFATDNVTLEKALDRLAGFLS